MSWKHPGRQASDYSRHPEGDHDRRTYASMGPSYAGKGPRGYRRSDDSIREEVCEVLKWDPDVDASEVDVDVQAGVVRLEGRVDSRHVKRWAERLIDPIPGVVDVQNRLTIKPGLDVYPDKSIGRGDDGLFTQEILPK